MTVLQASRLPLRLFHRGKVREVYEVDPARLLLMTSDRISAFDVVMDEPIPHKGAVLTQLSAWWFARLGQIVPHHLLSADAGEIIREVPVLAPHRDQLAGRAMLVHRTTPIPFECVVRGYLAGSAWSEYQQDGTLAGEPMPNGLVESARLPTPLFSPATKAEVGHDENVPVSRVADALGLGLAQRLESLSLALYRAGCAHAEPRGILLADTKFEFGLDDAGLLRLIDEVLTPDSSRFWRADTYQPGRSQPSFDKQPLRDWLDALRRAGRWNGEAPGPTLPADVIEATSLRYREAYRRITGVELDTGA